MLPMTDSIVLLLTGIPEIDRQHTLLVKCLDDLLDFVGGKYEFAAGFTAIQTLLDYTEQHFAFEEDLLAKCAYPKLDAHIAEHKELLAEVRSQWARIERGDADIAQEVAKIIRQWILEHINAEDVEYAKYLSANS